MKKLIVLVTLGVLSMGARKPSTPKEIIVSSDVKLHFSEEDCKIVTRAYCDEVVKSVGSGVVQDILPPEGERKYTFYEVRFYGPGIDGPWLMQRDQIELAE